MSRLHTAELESNRIASIPPAILDAVASSVTATFSSILVENPTAVLAQSSMCDERCIVGIISLFGETKWTFSLILSPDSATGIVEQFCGYRIEFADADMGDAVGELVNVLAGFIVDEFEKRGRAARMSLPTMIRGQSLEFVPERARPTATLGYLTKYGRFALRIAGAGTTSYIRLPGK